MAIGGWAGEVLALCHMPCMLAESSKTPSASENAANIDLRYEYKSLHVVELRAIVYIQHFCIELSVHNICQTQVGLTAWYYLAIRVFHNY